MGFVSDLPHLPADHAAFRKAIYEGAVFRLPASEASRALVGEVRARLQHELGDGPIEQAQFRFEPGEWFSRIVRVRRMLTSEPRFVRLAREVIAATGLDAKALAVDPPRLRAVAHRGHEVAAAAPAYYAHRDTWYANPQAQINWWLPLHDVPAEETFVFFSDVFARAVANDSQAFDYTTWSKTVGFQNPNRAADSVFPAALEPLDLLRAEGFSARAGEVLLFSAAHLHRTNAHASGRTRFSLDFRTVHLGDQAQGLGAPNVDNASRGSTLSDFPPEVA